MADTYRINLNLCKAKGLTTHAVFVDISNFGKFGQWGHKEFTVQATNQYAFGHAVKYKFIIDWLAEQAQIRSIDAPVGAVPHFVTDAVLPPLQIGRPYSTDLVAAGGNGARTLAVIGALLPPGVSVAPVSGDPDRLRIAGSASNEINAGMAYVFSMSLPSTESTLDYALANNHYVTLTIAPPPNVTMDLRGAAVQFTIGRIGYHAARRYALFSSVQGFASNNVLFMTPRFTDVTPVSFACQLPDSAAYQALTAPVGLRIYGFAGQCDDWDGDALAIQSVIQPASGSAAHTSTTITYTPPAGYAGTATVAYVISDGRGASDAGALRVFVVPEAAWCAGVCALSFVTRRARRKRRNWV
jgi:hypothetical protein